MIRTLGIVCVAALVAGCASPPPWKAKWSSSPESDALAAPPELSQPDSAAAAAASAPGAAQATEAMPGVPAAAEPSAEPAADSTARGMETLGEISSNTVGTPATIRPCNLDNCGVIISIGPRSAQELPTNPGSGPGDYVGGAITDGGYAPEQSVSEAYVSSNGTTLWEIVVQMHDGSMLPILQTYEPLLQVGDSVLVGANSIELWN